jgi:hypothetical protein
MPVKLIPIAEVMNDLQKARDDVDRWIAELQRCLESQPGLDRDGWERAICEATRMLLACGGFLHGVTIVAVANESERPPQAWDAASAAKAWALFAAAEDRITFDEDRKRRISDRCGEFQRCIVEWCPDFTAPSQ